MWPWFLLPPAVALGMILLWPDATVSPRITRQPDRPTAPAEHPGPAELEFASNPLELEKLALQRDARRAGRFLIDCLPSLAGSE